MPGLLDIVGGIRLEGRTISDDALRISCARNSTSQYGCDCGACDDGGYCIDSECCD